MKKLTLISVVIGLCLAHKCSAQNLEIVPFQIGERVPDLPLKNIINYKDSTATLSVFGDKIIILVFWNIHCGSCISMMPKEDSLQALFPDDVQFIMVTEDSKEKVEEFLTKYNGRHKTPLGSPIMTNAQVFSRMFRFTYIPHYVWIAPNGMILAQTGQFFITPENISNTLIPIRKEEVRLQDNKFADQNLKMLKPSEYILRALSIINQ